jgi:hypothetical protein
VLSVCVAPDPGLLKVIESKSAPPPKSQKPQPAVPATVGKRPNAHKGA